MHFFFPLLHAASDLIALLYHRPLRSGDTQLHVGLRLKRSMIGVLTPGDPGGCDSSDTSLRHLTHPPYPGGKEGFGGGAQGGRRVGGALLSPHRLAHSATNPSGTVFAHTICTHESIYATASIHACLLCRAACFMLHGLYTHTEDHMHTHTHTRVPRLRSLAYGTPSSHPSATAWIWLVGETAVGKDAPPRPSSNNFKSDLN